MFETMCPTAQLITLEIIFSMLGFGLIIAKVGSNNVMQSIKNYLKEVEKLLDKE